MADTTENQAPVVDETPISSVGNPARKNSLSTYLKNRPERSELVESTSHDSNHPPAHCSWKKLALKHGRLGAMKFGIASGKGLDTNSF